jgi:hypothetical protein
VALPLQWQQCSVGPAVGVARAEEPHYCLMCGSNVAHAQLLSIQYSTYNLINIFICLAHLARDTWRRGPPATLPRRRDAAANAILNYI